MDKKSQSEKRKPGRPSIGAVMVPVRLPVAMIEAIDAVTEPGRRAEFIRSAIERELARLR